jgi:hypothetical protein
MPLVRSALIATAACLIGAAAYAQTTGDTNMPAGATTQATPQQTPDNGQVGAAPQTSTDMSAQTGAAVNTSATTATGDQVIASQPVPDTPANRKAYGQPLSRAGKRTAPAGN